MDGRKHELCRRQCFRSAAKTSSAMTHRLGLFSPSPRGGGAGIKIGFFVNRFVHTYHTSAARSLHG